MPAASNPEAWAKDFAGTFFDAAIEPREYVRARDQLAALRRRADAADKLAEGLTLLVEQHDEPCRYDHNDFCQSHYSNRPCNIETARAALAEYEQEKAR